MDSARLTKLGKYEILDVIGRGGMGVVYKAIDPAIGRLVAIKMITAGISEDPNLLKRFYREAQSTGTLQHPNIVTVYDLGDDGGIPYLVMEFVEGETMEGLIRSRREMPLAEKLSLMVSVCDGLDYAHHRGVIHRDIKPANLIIPADGALKIVDFGIARFGNDHLTRTGRVMGSIFYMSPEQINGNELDVGTDIYSTAVVLFELLTWELPFHGKDTSSTLMKILNDPVPPLSRYLSEYPAELDQVLGRAMAKSRYERYATIEEFAFDLQRLQEDLRRDLIGGYLRSAEGSIGRSDWAKAKESLHNVLKLDRQNTRANELVRVVQSEIQKQQISDQVRQLRERAEEALRLRQWDDALSALDHAIELEPDSKLLQLREAVRQRRDDLLRAITRAERAHRAGELEDAQQAVSEALAADPGDTQAKALKAIIAKELAERAKRKQIEELLADAHREISAQNFTAAAEVLKRAEVIDPASAEVRQLAAFAKTAQQQQRRKQLLDKFTAEIEQALNRDEYGSALSMADEALFEFPTDAGLLRLRAFAEKQGDVWSRRIYIESQVTVAREMLDAGQPSHAADVLTSALSRYPDDANLLSMLKIANETLSQERARSLARQTRAGELGADALTAELSEPGSPQLRESPTLSGTLPIPQSGTGSNANLSATVLLNSSAKRGTYEPTPPQKAGADAPEQKKPRPQLPDQLRLLVSQVTAAVQRAGPVVRTFKRLIQRWTSKAEIRWSAVALLVVLLGLAIWAAIPRRPRVRHNSAVAVQVMTSPPGAEILINGESRGISNTTVELPLGQYQIEAQLSGYESAKTSFFASLDSNPKVELTLAEMPSQVRIAATDLEGGEVYLDDKDAGTIESGTLVLGGVPAGDHQVRISGTHKSEGASFQLHAGAGRTLSVSSNLEARDLQVIVITSANSAAHVNGTMSGSNVLLDGKPVGKLGNDGLSIADLGIGSHDLVIGEGDAERKMSFQSELATAVDVAVFSDRNIGSILVETRESDATIFLDGKPYRRKTQGGRLRIPGVVPGEHRIRVHKDGFKDSAEQTVKVAKGQESRLPITLEEIPATATLLLERLPAGSQVELDGKSIGQVDSEGRLKLDNIAPGKHDVAVLPNGFQKKTRSEVFPAGGTVSLSKDNFVFQRLEGKLQVLAAAGEIFDLQHEDGTSVQRVKAGDLIPLAIGNYRVISPAGSSRSVTITAGQTESLRFESTTTDNSMKRFHEAEWTLKDGWYTHAEGLVLYDSPSATGRYEFTLRLHFSHFLFSRPAHIRWVLNYLDEKNYTLMDMDEKTISRTDFVEGVKHPFLKKPHRIPEGTTDVAIQIEVTRDALTQRFAIGNQWADLWVNDGSAVSLYKKSESSEGKFGFRVAPGHNVEIANFKYTPLQK